MSTDYMVQALAASMHVALCYKGATFPAICLVDTEDAELIASDLRERGWTLTRISQTGDIEEFRHE